MADCHRVGFNDSPPGVLADAEVETVDEHPVHDGHRLLTELDLAWEILDLWWSDLDRTDDVFATLAVMIAERRGTTW